MDNGYHETVAVATTLLPSSVLPSDFLPGAKFFPVSPHTKRPAIIGWQAAATSDPAQHAAWAAQFPGCGWAIACAESDLIGVEIDPKARKLVKDKSSQQAGQERAEQAWRNMWTPRGGVAPWPPHTRSPSGGSHFIFRAPGVNVKALRQGGLVRLPEWQQHVIETRVNGYLLIPPSEFDGCVYTRPEGGPSQPYDAPPWLIEMMMRRTDPKPGEAPAPIVKPGSYNLRQLAKYVCKVHHRVGLPRNVWMATIFALVAQYGRYVAWQIAQAIHDGEPDTSDQIDDLVGRASETFRPGDSTLDTLFKHARENGIHDVVPPSISFGFPAEPLDINQILKEIDMEELKTVEAAPPLAPSLLAAGTPTPAGLPPGAVSLTGGTQPLPEHSNLTAPQAFALEDFVAYRPASTFCYLPTREMWGATGVNSKIGKVTVNCAEMSAAVWLSLNIGADAMAWCPGEPTLIKDRLLVEGGWIEKIGDTTLNTYRPATIKPCKGDPALWLDHIKTIYPDDWQHIINWLAHRVQRPGEKINHALVLGGEPKIGKDTLLEPVKSAIGAWNFCDVSPANIMGRFNSHLKSVVLRISEVHDLGDIDRFAFYDKTKTLCAAPPDTQRIDEKHMREYQAVNVCGPIMTTNHKAGGLYLPPDDRRHYVAWSPTPTDFFTFEYFDALYRWFRTGGNEIVAHYLASLDISTFNAKASPPKTPAFWEMVQSARAPESADVEDALDAIERPDAVTSAMLEHSPGATPEFRAWLGDRKNNVKVSHRMTDAGYEPVRNPDATDGRWRIGGKRRIVYGRRTLGKGELLAVVATMVKGPVLPLPSPMVQLPPPPPMLQLPPPPY